MKNIIGKLFGGESEEKKNERILKANDLKDKAAIYVQNKRDACDVKLQKCDEEFRNVIESEKELIRKRKIYGQPTEESYERVRQAAIGRIVVRSARAELQQKANEDRLNRALNGLGISIRQLYHLYGTEVKEKNADAILSMLGSSGEELEEVKECLKNLGQYDVPEETDSLVGSEFVHELLATGNLDLCIDRSRRRMEAQAAKAAEEAKKIQELNGAYPELPDDIDPRDIRIPEKKEEGSADAKTRSEKISADTKDYEKILRENADFY